MMHISSRIIGELVFFAHSFVWGLVMMVIYGLVRAFRCFVKHGVAWVAVEDLVYWVLYGLLLFRMIYLENDGMIRGFALLAIFFGTIFYFQIEKFLIFCIKKLQNAVKGYIIKRHNG